MPLYYITVATLPHEVLEKIKERVHKNGETIEVLGQQENRQIGWENQQRFGVKLREVADYLQRPHLKNDDMILFTDAYDVAYFGTQKEIVERYKKFNCPIVFGAEKECHPDPGRARLYKKTDKEFSYLNSGLFIGTVSALRSCMGAYMYDDMHDDQRYWTTCFFESPELIQLDYDNKLFLNTSNMKENLFMFDEDVAYYKGANPLFVHVNGPEKSFIKELVGLNNIHSQLIDIVITVGPHDIKNLQYQIIHTKKNVKNYRNIYLVSYDPHITVDGCITIDERRFPFTLQDVGRILGKNTRNGWYLQQLLKIYAGKIILDLLERFVCIDSDTFFVKEVEFTNPDTKKPRYCFSSENHQPYFDHMKRLHPSFRKMDPEKSGICHHMVFEKRYLSEMMTMTENHHKAPFHTVFLENVAKDQVEISGASEFEIYFNFMLQYHPDQIEIRKLIWEDIINWSNILDWDRVIKMDPTLNHDFVAYHHHLNKGVKTEGF